MRPNTSLIATAARYNVPCARELVSYFTRFYSNVNYSGRDHFKTSDVFDATEFFMVDRHYVHRMGDKEQKLPFWYESSGTQAAYVLLEKILPALEHGGIVIIDEMEADLHPEMITVMLETTVNHKPG